MSAIVGIWNFNKQPVSHEHSGLMMQALQKFPADDIQVWHKENIFLGCHAQWITPESVGEQQPFYDYDRQLAITADAIIDNRDELFEALQINHEDRKVIPDSLLILLAYEKWGEDSPKHLIGDFAFMIWDEKAQKLFGARDFSGRRTLYYFIAHNRLAFSTTIKPLLELPFVKKELNEVWLAEFLATLDMFDTVDTHSTIFNNINQIPPSHTLVISDKGKKLSRYLVQHSDEKIRFKSNDDYVEAFRSLFQRAVNDRLRTHHKVGSQLSGGLDSGSVVSYAANTLRHEGKKIETLSYIPSSGFVDWTPRHRLADERPLISETVNFIDNVNDHYFSFEGKSPLTEMDDWLEIMEMPYKFFENSFWLKGMYEEAEKLNIGILLNGKRGNYSISWGPALDYYTKLVKRLRWLTFYKELSQYSRNVGVGRRRMLSIIKNKLFPDLAYLGEQNEELFMINPSFAAKTNVFNRLRAHHYDVSGHVVNGYEARWKQFNELHLLNIGGANGTKLSIKHALWERDPTNDLRVVKYCLALPDEQYIHNGIDRLLVRRATESYLPDGIRLNQSTRGIQGADAIYRMKDSWSELISEFRKLTKDPIVSEYFQIETLNEAIAKVAEKPRLNDVYSLEFKTLMRSLIVYKFLKSTFN